MFIGTLRLVYGNLFACLLIFRRLKNGAGEGVRTCTGDFALEEETAKDSANNTQSSYEKSSDAGVSDLETARLPSNKKQPFEAQKYAQCMHLKAEVVAERQAVLAQVVQSWHSLPEHICNAIKALVGLQ